MRRLTPVILLGFALVGCSSDQPGNSRPGDKSAKPIDPSLVQATVEVKGMT